MYGIQPTYSFVAANSNESSKDVFEKTIMDTLQNIANNGFDKDFLKATIASYNMSRRSESLFTPALGGKGLNLADLALTAWIYDKDPTLYFDSSDVEKKIMGSDSNSYFQNLIKECFLNNSQHSLVIVMPEKGLETQKTEDQKKALAEYKDKIGTEGCKALVETTQAYDKWENRTDSKEALATLPRLSLKDVTPELPDLTYNVSKENGVTVLTHNTDLNGFSSINLYFDTSGVPQKQLPYLTLLSSLLGNIGTSNHTSQELSNEMAQCMVSPVVFAASSVAKSSYSYSPKITASMIVPDENISQASTIVKDIVTNTKFTDKKKIKEYIKQTESGLQMIYGSNSGYLAIMNLNAYMSEAGKYNNQLAGEAYYKFLKDLDKNFDSKWKEISKNLKSVYKLAFNKNGLIASHSGSESSIKEFKAGLGTIVKNLNSNKIMKQRYKFTKTSKNVAYSTSGKVQTVIQAGKLKDAKVPFSGKMLVLQNILNTGYLWDKIRTSGGAYTVGSSFSMDGSVIFYSQSDPNLKETLDVFAGTADYLRNFTTTDEEMSNYIIGAVKDFVNLKSSGAINEGALCDSMYLSGMTADDLLNVEKEALSTTAQDIRGYADLIDQIIKQNIFFVEGSKDKIDQDKNLFEKVVAVKY
jgi:Zn-dependent M16 (insulinase) family peptidase